MISTPALKFCPCCSVEKAPDFYSPDRRNKDGLNYRCKSCSAAHVVRRRLVDSAPSRLAVRKYRASLETSV